MDNLKALFDLTKLPAKFFFLFAVLSGFILFADAELLKQLHLEKLNDLYGWIVGLVFISTSGLVFVNSIIWIFKSVSNKLTFRKIKKEYIEKLRNLDYHEKSVLREFIINQTSSLEVPIDNSTITGLISKKIIYINQQFGNGFIMNGMNASVSLSKFVDKHLKLEDIGLNSNPTQADYEFVENNRPSWVENRLRRKSMY
ncbi:Superinfection exclusion protein B domain protein [Flavobacterium anhuiense]|uniref:Superinfection exclusion protein B domain protein n=1 Tax=Flavobacterium anhuiense TaxID=459526 RepID=A0A444W0D0_9FLAO|nr:super-infection exclusion protein B [Flavobacterium anhuiense]RYJ39309.1 Superinfection exclusion protein B domain protein [Flavobacterium anhuiense]